MTSELPEAEPATVVSVTTELATAEAVPPDSVPAAAATGGSHAAPRRSSLGVWAFALSLLGITLLPIAGSILGFVLGRVAIRKAATAPVLGGRGLAIAAVVISLIALVTIAVSVAAYALVVAYLPI